jgi:hypothetical protein
MQKRNVLYSPRLLKFKKNKRKIVFKKISFFCVGLLLIFIFLIYLSRLNNLNIKNIEITGNKIVDTEAIQTTIQEQISGKYLWLFPKTNILFFPGNSIKKALEIKFPRLENINLSIKDNKTLEVSLTERTAKYIWCGDVPDVGLPQGGIPTSGSPTSGTNCYFMDENGYIFDKAPYFSGEVYFRFYGVPDVGSYFSKQNFQQLISFKNALTDFGLKPVMLYITNNGEVEVFLSSGNSSAVGPEIIFKLSGDYPKYCGKFRKRHLTNEPLQSEFKNKYSSLLYIDLQIWK